MTKMKEVNQKLFDKCKQHLEDNQKLQLEKETLQDRLQQLQLNFAERERELQVKHFFTLSSSTIISEPTDCNPGQADQCFNAKQVIILLPNKLFTIFQVFYTNNKTDWANRASEITINWYTY